MNLRSVLRSRTVIVAIWLAAAFQFLWWQQPGFWRTPYLRYEEAQALVADRRTEEAIAEMAQALAEDPGNAGYATFKGFLELAAPRPAEAEASFRRALELTADDIDARLGLAESLVRQERAAEGLQALAALDDQTPDMEQRLRRRVIHALAGDYAGALGDPAVFDNGHADWLRLREGLRWAMAAADWDTAVLLADRVLAATDNVAVRHEAMNEKAQALRSLEHLDEALALFEQVPTPENLAARAELSLQLERYTAAARLFGERRAADPANADLLRPSAYAFERARQFENAIAAYRTLLDREDTVETRLLLVTLLNSLKRHAEAWETLAPLPRPADDLGVLRLQASTAFWAGRLRKADDLFSSLRTRRPGDAASRRIESDLGHALSASGDLARAERIYRRLLAEGDDAVSRRRLTDLLNSQQRYADAWTVARLLDPADPAAGMDAGEVMHLQARTAFWAREYKEAATRLRAHLGRHANDHEAWRDLAEAARQLGDEPAEEAALTSYLPLQPADATGRVRLAGLLESRGRISAAIDHYRVVVDEQPTLALARTLAFLEAREGLGPEAIRHYALAWELATPKDPELALALARLHRGAGRADEALAWYERSRQLLAPDRLRPTSAEAAWAALEAGQASTALAFVEPFARQDTADDGELLVAARAAGDADASAGAQYLERLGRRRALTTDEQRWLAGFYRTAGNARAALTLIEALAAQPGGDPGLHEAIGDLRWELKDFTGAAAAFGVARAAAPSPRLTLKVARLEAALGHYDRALQEYDAYLTASSPEGLRVEIARTSLGAGDWARAERWAREASGSSERGFAADMTLAEALHLQGALRESVEAFDELPEALRSDSTALEMYGRLSAARNQHQRAARAYQTALDQGHTTPGEIWYWSGVSQIARGDFSRASTALDQAQALGAVPALVQQARTDLSRAVAPLFSLPARLFGDSNDLSVRQAGVRGQLWPSPGVPLFGEIVAGDVSQRGTRYDRQRAVVGLVDSFVASALTVGGEAGAERVDGRSLFVGRGRVRFTRDDTSFVSAEVERRTFWSPHDRRDPREFNRVIDLAGLGPDMRVTQFRGAADTVVGAGRRLRLEGGAERYGDGNTRGFAYGHYEMMTTAAQGRWSAIAPNLYWESYRRDSANYFSPSQFVALGGLLHTIRSTPAWRLELEANPTATWYQSSLGFTVHGVVDASRTWGRTALGAGAFVFYDQRANYASYRLVAQFAIRLDP